MNDKIEVIHGYKKFNENIILDDISLKFESGKIYGIVGYNGSGKTVLFKCICGFYKLDRGSIIVNGKTMGKDIKLLDNAGIIIEEPAFLRGMSGYKNLEFLYTIRHKKNKNLIYDTMRRIGLDPLSKKSVEKYSLGMRQRLALAQATMENQDILILDEPMNGLDKEGVVSMRKFLESLKQEGKLILLASHNRDDINILCDEVYEIDRGKMIRIDN